MVNIKFPDFLFDAIWCGWRRWVIWTACIAMVILLGAIRKEMDAEFAFASFAFLPVLVIAWLGGRWNGLFMAFFAAAVLAVGEITSGLQFSETWIPWANAATRLITFSLLAFLSAQVNFQFRQEHDHAARDALTGLSNRRVFIKAGEVEVERSKRYGHSLAVVFLDLDDFKQLNDTRGHDVGDAALQATAGALLETSRANDRVARLGGDEFAVLLPEIGYDAAVDTGRKLFVAVIGALRDFPPVRVSVGVAWFGGVDRKFPEMLKAADELMYEVKESGKSDMRSRHFTATNKH